MSTQYKAILTLGAKLVGELGLEHSDDTLCRWMAHHIAQLMNDAESATPEERPYEQDRCAAAILELWRHRAELPDGKRPLAEVDPILRSLASLDPLDKTPRYFSEARAAAADIQTATVTDQWLELANGIDTTAKDLIRHCLARAAQTASDETAEWVTLAEEAGQSDDIDIKAIRILIEEASRGEDPPEDTKRRQIEKRIEQLDAFLKLADDLAADLRSRF